MGEAPTVAILGTRYIDFNVEEDILGPHGVILTSGDGASGDAIVEQASSAGVVLAGAGPRFDAATLARLRCRGIVRYGVGVDTIDLDAAARSGMWVAYVPDYGTDAVALHTVTLVLTCLRRVLEADSVVKSGGWGFSELRPLRTPEALTVGIVGFGRIGKRVADFLSPFGFELIATDAFVDVESAAPGVHSVDFEELLRSADVVTLHAPGGTNGPLIGHREIKLFKPGSVIVNTARGSLVDSSALVAGLEEGRPGFAALDVFEQEPPVERFQAVADRVVLTPHMAWYTQESELDLRTKAAHEALRILRGDTPLNPVAKPKGAA
ncbi:MAG: C-terminal binding protein [Actinomycetota bacterium]